MSSPGEIAGYVVQAVMYALLGTLLYFLIASIYYKFNQEEVPPDWWPETLTGWVHDFPPEYSMVANVYVNGTVSNTFTANVLSAEECAYGTDKAAGCNDVEKCIGFKFQKAVAPATANTCTLYSSVKFAVSNVSDMLVDYYVFAGTENPLYNLYSGRTFTSNVASTLAVSTVTGALDGDVTIACLALCSSNVTCTGVNLVVSSVPAVPPATVATSSGVCAQQTAEIVDTSITALTGSDFFKKDATLWTAAGI